MEAGTACGFARTETGRSEVNGQNPRTSPVTKLRSQAVRRFEMANMGMLSIQPRDILFVDFLNTLPWGAP